MVNNEQRQLSELLNQLRSNSVYRTFPKKCHE